MNPILPQMRLAQNGNIALLQILTHTTTKIVAISLIT